MGLLLVELLKMVDKKGNLMASFFKEVSVERLCSCVVGRGSSGFGQIRYAHRQDQRAQKSELKVGRKEGWSGKWD